MAIKVLPDVADITNVSFNQHLPSKTYRMDTSEFRIGGMIDEAQAIKQAIYCILQTDRYSCQILSRDYGIEKADLFGKPVDFAAQRLERRISEALTQDDRIEKITNYQAEEAGPHTLHVSFTAVTTAGDIGIDQEVMF
jgi:phage baseplate assembly protein W